MNGLRFRVGGAHWARWVQSFGGTSVSLTVGELPEAMDQGVIDCTASSAPELVNMGMIDTVTDITLDVPGGLYAGASGASTNQQVWRSLTSEQRRALLKAGAYYSADVPYQSVVREQDTLDQARAAGIRVHSASPEMLNATREFVKKDLVHNIDFYASRYKVSRGEEMMGDFRALLEKWIVLVQDINSSEELGQLYWDEIYSKVDVNSHGL